MSTMIRTEGRAWWQWAAAAGTLIAALVLIGALAVPTAGPNGGSQAPTPVTAGPDGGPLPQAPWAISVFPAGAGKPSKAQKKLVDGQRDVLQAAIGSIFDQMLLERSVGEEAGKFFTAEAMAALNDSKLTLPKGMTGVQTTKRIASVGVDSKATHAAAKATIAFKGTIEGKIVKLLQKTILWLERAGNGWRVIGFEGEMVRRK